MIERIDNKIYLTNWEKHQNIESLEKIRLDTKNRVAKHRERQKAVGINECNVTVTPNVTQCNAIELELEEEIEKEIKIKKGTNKFVKPTLDEVSAYCLERKNNINPQYFIDYQDAREWVLSNGRKMKDWKATIIS